MTARRPNVPRAGRPSPQAEERPATGMAKGQTSARGAKATGSQAAPGVGTGARGAGHQQNPAAPAQSRTAGPGQRRPAAPRAAGPSATKDPRAARSAAEGSKAGAGSGSTSATPAASRPTTARQQATPQRPSPSRSTSRSDSSSASRSESSTASRSGSRSGSHSGSRAAERSQLAGSIRRGRLGSRRAESAIQPAEEATPIPAKSFSGRLLALAVVLIAVIVLLAPSVSRYVQQQAELDALRADIARQQQEQADYRSELARWDDPAFVKQQARERIFLVMPGETRYLVKGEDGIEKGTGEGSAAEPAELPWADSLWNSITRAATD